MTSFFGVASFSAFFLKVILHAPGSIQNSVAFLVSETHCVSVFCFLISSYAAINAADRWSIIGSKSCCLIVNQFARLNNPFLLLVFFIL